MAMPSAEREATLLFSNGAPSHGVNSACLTAKKRTDGDTPSVLLLRLSDRGGGGHLHSRHQLIVGDQISDA